MKSLAFASLVYPRTSIDAAVGEFSALCHCRITHASPDQTVIEFEDGCPETVVRELANFALEHAVVSRA